MPGVARCVAHGMVLCRAPRGCMLPSRHRTIVVTAAVAVVITIIITVIIIITFIHITIMNTPTQTALPAVADAGAQTKAHHSLLLHMDVMDAVMPHLDTEHAGKLLKAIYYYGSMAAGCGRDYTAELAEQLDDLAMKLLFGSIKTRIDHDIDKWRKACKTSESRAQAGRRGGRHAAAADGILIRPHSLSRARERNNPPRRIAKRALTHPTPHPRPAGRTEPPWPPRHRPEASRTTPACAMTTPS